MRMSMSMRLEPPKQTRTTLEREPERVSVKHIRHTDRPRRPVHDETPIVLLKARKFYYIADGNCRFANHLDRGLKFVKAWVLTPEDKGKLQEPMTAFLRAWQGGRETMRDLIRHAVTFHKKAMYR